MTGRSLSRELVERATGVHRKLPDEVLAAARLHLLDALGVGVAGAARGPLRELPRIAAGHPGGRSTVLGIGTTTTAPVAALVNGSLIHSLEYDDTHVASVMHGSSTVAAAALAVAQEVDADGADLLSAFTLGWELLVRMGLASPGTLQARGFQTTSAAGPFAAALVSGLLHEDPQDTLVEALGIAGSQPGGTFAFLEAGDTVKAGQPGWAAHSGLWAAELARGGMTGPEGVLEGKYGFFQLYAGDAGAPDRLRVELSDLGERWHLTDAAFKLIPCCHFIHPFVEALGNALDTGIAPDEVASVHCHVPRGAAPIIADPWPARQRPATPHDVRWSLPYVLAARVVDGEVGLALFDEPIGGDRLDLALRVTHELWDDSGFPAVFPARLSVTTHDGRTVEASVDDVLGGAGRPVAPEAVVAKARSNFSVGGLAPEVVDRLVAEVVETESPDVNRLAGLLRRG
ncbi:MmgE/PrpD family protein [Nocardioides caldifontis]|uniref:MmgE/PrpD family protein n=1 Tax=Nocardioides caldifontis TaxID=2588938 RepID=UPI0011DFFD2C|nr:MmgE/PrpD family protein [Nocardioides caldifontis]